MSDVALAFPYAARRFGAGWFDRLHAGVGRAGGSTDEVYAGGSIHSQAC